MEIMSPWGRRGCSGSGPEVQCWDVAAGGETRGCLCMLGPSQEGKEWGAGEELGPTLFRAMTWAGTGFQTYKPQSAQSLY